MINSTFSPASIADFDRSKLQTNNIGTLGSVAAGVSGNIELTLTDDHLLTGLQILAKGSNFGDYFILQVVDEIGALPNGMSFPAGTVLNQFGTSIYVADDVQEKINIESEYPAKLLAGMTLRLTYFSTGSADVQVAINWRLHKVLI